MDSSFGIGPYTPSRARQSSVSSVMSAGRKSLHGGLKKGLGSSRFSLAGRSGGAAAAHHHQTHHQFATKADQIDIKSFGLPLPVLVNEALTFSERNANVTIGCSDNGGGWAWAVAGRRLLVWQHNTADGGADGGSSITTTPTLAMRANNTPQRRTPATGQCRELTLPHCDIGHKASLVCVFVGGSGDGGSGGGGGGGQQQMASCLAVSPAGDVRYWPSIAHDGSSIDAASIMDGQEFDAIVALPGVGYMLATTTCSLLLLQLQLNGGRHTIVQRPVRPPTGFLGGIGKRFASIIIGLNSNQEREHKFIKLCAVPGASGGAATGDWQLAVLADRWIQRWSLNPVTSSFGGGPNGAAAVSETHLFEDFDLFKRIRDAFHHKLWSNRDLNELDVRLLDMHMTAQRTVLVLAAAINATHTPQFHYALCTFAETAAGGAAAPNSYVLQNFCQLRHTTFVSGGIGGAATAFQSHNGSPAAAVAAVAPAPMQLLVDATGGTVYVYDDKHMLQLQLSGGGALCGSGEPSDKVDFGSQGERLMAGMLYRQRLAVFFLRNSGFVCVTAAPEERDAADGQLNDSMANASQTFNGTATAAATLDANAPDGNLTLFELDPADVYDDTDSVSQLKAAFMYHVKKNAAKCAEVLAELVNSRNGVDLDALVVKIARDLVDDVPAADPRWEEQIGQSAAAAALGSSASMQIGQQLKEKRKVMQLFVEFLHAVELWPRLRTLPGEQRPTALVLADIGEKIVAAIALKRIHGNHAQLLDAAIQTVLRKRNGKDDANAVNGSGSLTAQDLFYVRVTRMHEIFRVLAALVATGGGAAPVEANSGDVSSTRLSDVNTIVLTLLADVQKARTAQHGRLFALSPNMQRQFEYVPWTAESGKLGLRDALQQLIDGTLKNGARATGDAELRQRYYRQMVELIDHLLDGRKSHLDSVVQMLQLQQQQQPHAQPPPAVLVTDDGYSVLLQQYDALRGDLIQPLVQDGQYELATKLAEKYLDFQTLVQICDRTENQQRLDEYIHKYRNSEFAKFAINWHLRQNKRGDLFERFKHQQAELSRFLTDHPSLAWVQAVFDGNMAKAARVLVRLADDETELVARKKTMLSLAKLVSLASDGDAREQVAHIDAQLRLIAFQATLSAELLEAYGYFAVDAKVLKAEEIINLLISDENVGATEAEFRNALELLSYVEETDEVRRKIWSAAIRRDDWQRVDMNAPTGDLANMLFFKLVDLCFVMDSDLSEFLPPIEQFADAPELADLNANKTFQFLFRLGYEHIRETYLERM